MSPTDKIVYQMVPIHLSYIDSDYDNNNTVGDKLEQMLLCSPLTVYFGYRSGFSTVFFREHVLRYKFV